MIKDTIESQIIGVLKITDKETGEILVQKRNAIHPGNMAYIMALALACLPSNLSPTTGTPCIGWMAFGNGGSSVDPTGVITYLPPNTVGQNAGLYNETYAKVVDDNSAADTDPTTNYMSVLHTAGTVYTDILVTCLLDYGEPPTQQAFDNSTNFNGEYVFDELGLKSYSSTGNSLLLTHVIFHPVQKSLNRLIQVDYTVRIQSLTGLAGV